MLNYENNNTLKILFKVYPIIGCLKTHFKNGIYFLFLDTEKVTKIDQEK